MRNRSSKRSVRAAVAALVATGAAAVLGPAVASAQGERALELVSPPGVDANVTFGASVSTPDGELTCFHSENAYLGAFSTGLVTPLNGYCARRNAAGWRSEWATGPRPPGRIQSGQGAQVYFVSPDGERVVFTTALGLFGDWAPPDLETGPGFDSAYMREAGATRWLAPSASPPGPERGIADNDGTGNREPLAVSEDLQYGVFNSTQGIVAQDSNDILDVYMWTPEGVRLVSRDADGNAVGGVPPLAGSGVDRNQAQPGTMSRDGSRVFFLHSGGALEDAPAGVYSVFMREGDDVRLVSPRRGPVGPAEDIRFAGATANGGTVYLSTTQQLTSEPKEAGLALYRYDVAADDLALVATHPDGIRFLDLSADGSTLVYSTVDGAAPPLMAMRDGVEHVLGTADPSLDTGASFQWGGVLSVLPYRRGLRVSDDGRVVVFGSAGEFAGMPAGTTRIYRWEASEGVEPIAVDEQGQPSAGSSHIGNFSHLDFSMTPRYNIFLNFMRGSPNLGRVMTEDGDTVFFETTERLVEADINDHVDVYQWRNGRVSLISPGTQDRHAYYHDSSSDGRTVFFTTASRLIPELDRNATPDLYAARVGGGFPLPPTPVPCAGDGCQGDVPPPPRVPTPSSAGLSDEGNVVPPVGRRARHSVLRLTRRQLRAFAATGRSVVRTRVSRSGVVRVVALARIGGRSVRVGAARARASRAGMVRMSLRLSRRARLRLDDGRRLALTLRVSYSRSGRVVSRRVVLGG